MKIHNLNNSKNILFISYDGLTDPLGQSQIIPYLAGLTQFGYRFTILSCEKPEKFQNHKSTIIEILKPLHIGWEPIIYHKNPPVFSSIYDVMMLKKKAKQLHKKHHFQLVHTRPGVPALIGLWMKKKWGVKFLNDIREFYADSRVDGGMWNKQNFFYHKIYDYFKKKEEEAIVLNDGIVCLTHAAEKIIKSWPFYNPKIPIDIIPCSVDMNLFNTANITANHQSELRNKLKINDGELVISYLGSIGGWYLTAEMMQLCKLISDKLANVTFLFISPHQHEIILETARKYEIPGHKIRVTHAQRSEVPLLLSLSAFSIFFIKPCYSKLSSSPTKHGEIMAMGIPIITNSGVGDVKEIVEKYKSGIVLSQFSEAAFLSAVDYISNLKKIDNNSIRKGALEFYDLQTAIKKYHEMYQSILG